MADCVALGITVRQFTCLANDLSKKLENLGHPIALHFIRWNFR